MGAIGSALLRAIGMNVYVSDNGQSAGFAYCPQLAEMPAVEANDASNSAQEFSNAGPIKASFPPSSR